MWNNTVWFLFITLLLISINASQQNSIDSMVAKRKTGSATSNVLGIADDLGKKITTLNHTIVQLTRVMVTFSQLVNSFVSTSETRLDQKLTARFSRLETLMNSMESQVMQRIQQSGSGRDSTRDQSTDPPVQSSTARTASKKEWKQYGVTVAGGNGRGDETNQLYRPQGIFVDDDKTIYIADNFNGRVVQWKYNEEDGEIIVNTDRITQSNSPTDLFLDKQKDILLIASDAKREVRRYSIQNKLYEANVISDMDCWGVVMVKDGSIYVSDRKEHEVRRWKKGEKQGQIVAGGNGKGDGLNQLSGPTFIFVDENYSLYVSDEENNRVVKWTEDATEGIVVAGGNGYGSRLEQLTFPEGLFVDREGRIYVSDYNNHRVMRWIEGNAEGEIIVGGNGSGAKANQLANPTGLAFDLEGNLYVSDKENDRIQKFEKNDD